MKIKFPKIPMPQKTMISILKNVRNVMFNWLTVADKLNVPEPSQAVKKTLAAVLGIYLIIGLILGYFVYEKQINTDITRATLMVYPLPAAYANGHFVSLKKVFESSGYIKKYSEQASQKVDSEKEVNRKVIDLQIETKLIETELNRQGLSIKKGDVLSKYKEITDQNGGELEVKKVLKGLYGMSVGNFKSLIKDQLKKDKLREEGVERVKVRHILVADEKTARDIVRDLQENKKTFEDIAKEWSKDVNSRDKGGDLGKIARGAMPTGFDEAAFTKAPVGALYPEPVKTDFGWHIIKVEEKTGKIQNSFEGWLDDAKKKTRIIRFLK